MKVVLLTNILTPYRIYFYDMLYQEYKNMFEEYDAMGFTPDEESAMSWVAKNPEYRKYKYCPSINKSRLS